MLLQENQPLEYMYVFLALKDIEKICTNRKGSLLAVVFATEKFNQYMYVYGKAVHMANHWIKY